MEITNQSILIAFDEAKYKSKIEAMQRIGSIVQNIVNQFNGLGFPTKLQPGELNSLFTNPIHLVFDKMTGGQPLSIAGLTVDKTKAIDILVKPDGYETLMKVLNEVIAKGLDDTQYSGLSIRAKYVSEWFVLLDGQVQLSQAALDKLRSEFERYAVSENAKKMYNFAKAVLEKVEEFQVQNLLYTDLKFRHLLSGIDPERPLLSVNWESIIRLNREGERRF